MLRASHNADIIYFQKRNQWYKYVSTNMWSHDGNQSVLYGYLSITVNSRSQHSGSLTVVIFFYSSGNMVFNTTLNVIFYEGQIFK